MMKDGYNSAQRYYLNIFRDTYRQVLIGESSTNSEDGCITRSSFSIGHTLYINQALVHPLLLPITQSVCILHPVCTHVVIVRLKVGSQYNATRPLALLCCVVILHAYCELALTLKKYVTKHSPAHIAPVSMSIISIYRPDARCESSGGLLLSTQLHAGDR